MQYELRDLKLRHVERDIPGASQAQHLSREIVSVL